MNLRRNYVFRTAASALIILSMLLIYGGLAHAQSYANEITFDNQSGSQALVKLIGQTAHAVTVLNNSKETLQVGPGNYYILVRYGSAQGKYTYSKGRPFNVEESSDSYSVITITLHKVLGGNYETRPTTASEFDHQ
jgi:hypothetical protein